MEIRSSTPVKGPAGQEGLPRGGEEQSTGAAAGTTGGASPRAAQVPRRLRGAKRVPGPSFLLTLFFPARLKELFKVALRPRIPQRKPQPSALRIASGQRNKEEF